jgi:hypothetical protein
MDCNSSMRREARAMIPVAPTPRALLLLRS